MVQQAFYLLATHHDFENLQNIASTNKLQLAGVRSQAKKKQMEKM
jgi:hypothetical protein